MTTTDQTLHVYGMNASGNCYKIRLLLAQLQHAYHWHEVDVIGGQTRSEEYLQLNPNGKVPLLRIDRAGAETRLLPESNAILCYLAFDSPLLPTDRWHHAQVMQWLFFEQYTHEPAIAVARFINRFLAEDHPRREELPGLQQRAHQALAVMEQHLSDQQWCSQDYSIADIALFAYTHVADEAGVELRTYPAISRWLERVRKQPGFVRMDDF